MLIELSVENFRSIRHRQTISMVAAPRLQRKENTFVAKVAGEKLPALLKVAAIYGPNASGKSNLLRALDVLMHMIRRSPSEEANSLPVAPFKFDPALANSPSCFEIHFIEEELRYSYELHLTTERVVFEKLTCYPRGKENVIFQRAFNEGHDQYTFEALEGNKELHEAWRGLTGPQSLFIAQAVANSNEEFNQLRKPLRWLREVMVVTRNINNFTRFGQNLMVKSPSYGEDVAQFLSKFDVPITSIRTEIRARRDGAEESDRSEPSKVPPSSSFRTTLTHQTALGTAEFDLADESDGTRNLFAFALPWTVFRQGKTNRPRILFVDELDSSLHPKLVEALVRQHLQEELPCQLVFSTHDTHLMDAKLLRRDQIWLIERDLDGATQVRSVHDFSGREGEDIEKRYYEGRYRALPLVKGN